MTMEGTFRRQAAHYLPGFVYSFNVADFKRRNVHLGHLVGDRDIADLDRALKTLDGETAFVARTGGNRWHLVSRQAMDARVEAVLSGYETSEAVWLGWRAEATRADERAVVERVLAAEVRRAVRCLRADVKSAERLDAALAEIERNDHALPVGRVHNVASLFKGERAGWQCVTRYPTSEPGCALCGGTRMNWEDGDGTVYNGSGKCEGCGATVAITQIDEKRA